MLLQKIRSTFWGFSFPSWSVPIALLTLVLLSYGLRVSSLGFYWDDWPYLWFYNRLGPSGIIQAFAGDRPFLSFIYNTTLSIFGHSTTAWQIFALLARWLCSLGLWWVLKLTWPQNAHKTAWAVFLFTVYPGFSQQWISVIYGQAFFLFAALFFSIGITLWLARRRPARGWLVAGTILALALSAFTMFSTEYFFGLELLRPALLWFVLSECAGGNMPEARSRWQILRQQVGKAAIWWAPYLALMAAFVFWRSFIHVFAGYQMTTLQGLEQSPLIALQDLSITILKDMVVSSLVAWGQTLQLESIFASGIWTGLRLLGLILFTGALVSLYLSRLHAHTEQTPQLPLELARQAQGSFNHWSTQAILVGLFAIFASGIWTGLRLLGLILFTGALVSLYLSRLHALTEQTPQLPLELARQAQGSFNHWSTQAILVGLFAIIASGWPFWITGLPLRMDFPQDRFSLPLSVGVCLLLAGVVDGLGKNLPRKALVIGAAVALATGFHFNTSTTYREDWNKVRDFFWQLTWRAPSVEPDTLFLSANLPFNYYEDDSLTAPLNWTYDPDGRSTQMRYLLYDLNVRYHSLPPLRPGNPIEKDFRAAQFSGNTFRLLIFYYDPPGCVRILDPVYDADLYQLPDRIIHNMRISNPRTLIQDQDPSAVPPLEIFGAEPKRRWCYYFEKADLARQKGDWKKVVALGEQSIGSGYRPENPAEYLPFIEAYNREGYWEDAYELTLSTYQESPKLRPALCAVWRRTAGELTENKKISSAEIYAKANGLLNCPTP